MSKKLNDSVISGMRKSVVHPSLKIVEKCDNEVERNTCKEHQELKNMFVVKDFDKYKIADAFCSVCSETMQEEYERMDKKYHVKSFHVVIKKNKSKIKEIKELNLNQLTKNISAMNVDCQKSAKILSEKIEPISMLIEKFITATNEGVFDRINGSEETLHRFRHTKEFIDSMELTPNGDPILQNIGSNDEIKLKYTNLARFLLKWDGVGEIKGDYNGVVENFKQVIIQLNDMRKTAVTRMDMLMKAFLGPMYDFVFSLEGMEVDEEFRRRFLPEYINEEYVNKLKAQFQVELSAKDDRIAELEALLKKQKSEIASLNSLNAEYLSQNEKLSADMVSMKLEFEKKIRTALQALKIESEKKIQEVTDMMNEWKNKFNDLDAKYNTDTAKLNLEIKTLNTNYKNKIHELEVEIENLNHQIELLRNERDSAMKKNKDLNIQLGELRAKHSELETLHHETCENYDNQIKGLHADYKAKIASLEANIKKLNAQIASLTEERDDLHEKLDEANKKLLELRAKFNELTKKSGEEAARLKAEIKNLNDEHTALVNNLNGKLNLANGRIDTLNKEVANLRNQISELHDDLDHTRDVLSNTETLLRTTEKNYKNMVGDRDGEINTLTSVISLMKEDWENLNNAYDLLDSEIKKQLCCNDELRAVIRNLTENNHNHNDYINEHEAEMKQIFEQFVRCALKKKTIDFNDPSEKVEKCETGAMECKERLSKMRLKKPNQSTSFSSCETTLSKIKGGKTTFTEVKFPRLTMK